jgi:hypothetical protein
MMGGKSGAFRGFSSSCSPYIHTIISSYSHNNNLRNVVMPSRHTKTHACESGRMFPKWTERVNQVSASPLELHGYSPEKPSFGIRALFLFHFAGNDRIGNIRAVEMPAGMGSNLGYYLYERSSRFRSCLRHLAEPAGRMKG